jgi:Activator of Hsp90 ATPase homolog 1-like protein
MTIKPINKQITIKATPAKIWEVLLSKVTYLQWAKVFQEGSDYIAENNFEKGSKVIFGDGTGNGMVAIVSINEPNHKIQFTFTGEIKDGVESSMGSFDGTTETYTLTQNSEEVLLEVETSMGDEWYDSMDKAWDQAIVIIKELSEK